MKNIFLKIFCFLLKMFLQVRGIWANLFTTARNIFCESLYFWNSKAEAECSAGNWPMGNEDRDHFGSCLNPETN